MEHITSLEGTDELNRAAPRLLRSFSLPPTPKEVSNEKYSKLAKFLSKYHKQPSTNVPSSPSSEEQPELPRLTCSFSARRSSIDIREPSPPRPVDEDCEIIEIEVNEDSIEQREVFALGIPSELNLQSPINEEMVYSASESYETDYIDSDGCVYDEIYDEEVNTVDTYENLNLGHTTSYGTSVAISRGIPLGFPSSDSHQYTGCSPLSSDHLRISDDEGVRILDAEDFISPRSGTEEIEASSNLHVPFELTLNAQPEILSARVSSVSPTEANHDIKPLWALDEAVLELEVTDDFKEDIEFDTETLTPQMQPFPMENYILLAKKDIIFDRGSCGQIRLALHVPTCDVVALKFIGANQSSYTQAQNEIDILQKEYIVDNPHFVELCDYGMHDGQYVIALKYANAGNLESLIEENGPLDEEVVQYIARELLVALKTLHSNRLIHNDFKPSNVLLSAEGNIKLCDFGLTCPCSPREEKIDEEEISPCKPTHRILTSRSYQSTTSLLGVTPFAEGDETDDSTKQACAGTVKYIAPEKFGGDCNGASVDIWAFGITMFECCAGMIDADYGDELTATIAYKIGDTMRGNYSYLCQDFLSRCLEMDPMERYSVDELLEHPFLCPEDDVEEEYYFTGRRSAPVMIRKKLLATLPAVDSNLLIKIIEGLVAHHKKKSFLDGASPESVRSESMESEPQGLSSEERIANISVVTRFSVRQVRRCIKYYTRIQRNQIKNY